MIQLIILIAIVAMAIFMYMNYASQKRSDKQEERREEIKERIESIIQTLKVKEED